MTGYLHQGMSETDVIRALDLTPLGEGGYFKEIFRDPNTDANGRALSSAIYFLLGAGQNSHWHRLDAAEVWHWYAGAPLVITMSHNGIDAEAAHLGPDLRTKQQPQLVVPANCWQTATSLGGWTLCGCTVAPAFDFTHFEMAAPDWRPRPRLG